MWETYQDFVDAYTMDLATMRNKIKNYAPAKKKEIEVDYDNLNKYYINSTAPLNPNILNSLVSSSISGNEENAELLYADFEAFDKVDEEKYYNKYGICLKVDFEKLSAAGQIEEFDLGEVGSTLEDNYWPLSTTTQLIMAFWKNTFYLIAEKPDSIYDYIIVYINSQELFDKYKTIEDSEFPSIYTNPFYVIQTINHNGSTKVTDWTITYEYKDNLNIYLCNPTEVMQYFSLSGTDSDPIVDGRKYMCYLSVEEKEPTTPKENVLEAVDCEAFFVLLDKSNSIEEFYNKYIDEDKNITFVLKSENVPITGHAELSENMITIDIAENVTVIVIPKEIILSQLTLDDTITADMIASYEQYFMLGNFAVVQE